MRFISNSVLVAVAAGVCIAATVGPAIATGADYTVAPAGDTAMSVTSRSSILVFQDATPGHTNKKVRCAPNGSTPASQGSGVAHGGGHTFLPGAPVPPYIGYDAAADITTTTFGSVTAPCKDALVGNVTVTASGFPWGLGCTSKVSNGCNGYLYGVSAHFV